MGGVDKYYMMLKAYFTERKNVKWTNKFGVYCLHMIVHNANTLYTNFYNGTDKAIRTLNFRIILIEQLSEANIDHNDVKFSEDMPDNCDIFDIKDLGKLHHYPSSIGNKLRRECYVCKNDENVEKRVLTYYECKKCSVNLCAAPCFKTHHSKLFETESSSDESNDMC